MPYVTPVTLSIKPSIRLRLLVVGFAGLLGYAIFNLRLPLWFQLAALLVLVFLLTLKLKSLQLQNPSSVVGLQRSVTNQWQLTYYNGKRVLLMSLEAEYVGPWLVSMRYQAVGDKRRTLLIFHDQLSTRQMRILCAILRCDKGDVQPLTVLRNSDSI